MLFWGRQLSVLHSWRCLWECVICWWINCSLPGWRLWIWNRWLGACSSGNTFGRCRKCNAIVLWCSLVDWLGGRMQVRWIAHSRDPFFIVWWFNPTYEDIIKNQHFGASVPISDALRKATHLSCLHLGRWLTSRATEALALWQPPRCTRPLGRGGFNPVQPLNLCFGYLDPQFTSEIGKDGTTGTTVFLKSGISGRATFSAKPKLNFWRRRSSDGRNAGSGSWIVCAAPGRLLDLICAEEEEGEQFTDGPQRVALHRWDTQGISLNFRSLFNFPSP